MDEVWAGDNLLAFDGRVLEVFGHPATPSHRYHVENLDLTFDSPDKKGRRDLTLKAATKHSGGLALLVPAEDLPQVEPFVERVEAAMPSA